MPRAEQGACGNEEPLLDTAQQLDESVTVEHAVQSADNTPAPAPEHSSSPPGVLAESPLAKWLASHQLHGYADAIAAAGYDSLSALCAMTETDRQRLASAVKMKRPHARVFAEAIGSVRAPAMAAGDLPAAMAATPSPLPTAAPPIVLAQPVRAPAQAPQTTATPTTGTVSETGPCRCSPRCRSQLMHQRLATRAASHGCSLAEQRRRDKVKRDQEVNCATLWTGISLASLFIILQNT